MDKLKVVINQHHSSLEPEITGWSIFPDEPEQVTIYKGNRAYVILLGETVAVETWNAYENGDLGRVLSTTEIPLAATPFISLEQQLQDMQSAEQLEFPFVKEL
jgi:hypothetical protein